MGKVNDKFITSVHDEEDEDERARASDYLAASRGLDSAEGFLNDVDNWKPYDKIPGPDETIRMRYGNQYSQNAAKDRAFESGRRVRDSHTGEELCRTVKEAQSRYGAAWADHVAESDHVVPVKHIYEKHKNDTWLTQEDIREVVNDRKNFQQLSKKNNTTKGSRTEREYLEDRNNGLRISKKKRERIIMEAERTEADLEWDLTGRKAGNIARAFHESGWSSVKNSICETGLLSILTNLGEVMDNRKTFSEAMGDAAAGIGSGAARSYTISGGVTVAQRTLQNSEYEILKWMGQCNFPAKVVTAVQVCFTPVKQYLNGEIPMGECAKQITKASAELAITGEAAAIGQLLIPIPVVGAVAGTLVGMSFSKCLFSAFDSMAASRRTAAEMRVLQDRYRQLTEQYHECRMELEQKLARYFAGERKFYSGCLDLLDEGILSDNHSKVSEAARSITHHLGGTDDIETVDDLCALFDD